MTGDVVGRTLGIRGCPGLASGHVDGLERGPAQGGPHIRLGLYLLQGQVNYWFPATGCREGWSPSEANRPHPLVTQTSPLAPAVSARGNVGLEHGTPPRLCVYMSVSVLNVNSPSFQTAKAF